jgi:peptidoglycan/xylan/chitin deacetylase (PgdA/CDA1 family)
MNKALVIGISLLGLALPAAAQQDIKADEEAYCKFVTEQGKGEAVLLRTPSATGGLTQPNTGTVPQAYGGVKGSLSDLRKAGLTMDVARRSCDLYKMTIEAQQTIQYSNDALQKEALQNRVNLIISAVTQLDALIRLNEQKVETGNATRISLYALQSARTHLLDQKSLAERQMADKMTLSISTSPISQLVQQKQAGEIANQRSVQKLAKAGDWDLQWEAGAHHTIKTTSLPPAGINSSGTYGEATFSYNFGSRSVNKHFDAAADAYSEWKQVQTTDVSVSAEGLKNTVIKSIEAEDTRLTDLTKQQKTIDENLSLIKDATTNNAVTFLSQLQADNIVLRVEIKDAQYRKEQLENFLAYNFAPANRTLIPGKVSITFDDGYQTAYDALPIIDKAGLKATWYIITQNLGKQDYITTDEVKALAADGQEVGSHTRTHPHLTKLSADQQREEIVGTVSEFAALGLRPVSFAYPFGEFNEDSIAAAKAAGFTSARTVNERETGRDPYRLQGYPISDKTTVAEIKFAIDSAVRNGRWLILIYHRVDAKGDNAISVKHEDLQAVVDYLVQNKVKVVTVGEGMTAAADTVTASHCHSGNCRTPVPAVKRPVL